MPGLSNYRDRTMEDRVIPLAELPDDVAEVLRDRGAAQVNLYRALAHSPAMVETWLHFLWDLRDRCRTPRPLRELMILRTGVRSGSDYEWTHHVRMAGAAGVAEDKIAAVKEWPASAEGFDQDERVALELADAIVDGAVPDALVKEALKTWGAEGYVELVVTAAAYVMVPRVLDALRVPLEDGIAGKALDR